MGRTRKTKNASLGKSLMKKNKAGWDKTWSLSERHTTEPDALKSVTQETSYEEFIATASLAAKDFTAEKLNLRFVTLNTNPANPIDSSNFNYLNDDEKKLVVVPRRPHWTKEMTAEELDDAEKEAFLTWRRHMASLQEKDGITPFERNVEVWRQLWRVLEMSNIIIQIVDGRNPLLYRCNDLETYVKELGKQNVLLINKADFLTQEQRTIWSKYFDSVDLPHAFYSAALASAAATSKINEEDEGDSEEDDDTSSGESGAEAEHESDEAENSPGPINYNKTISGPTESTKSRILSRDELIAFLKSFNTSNTKPFNVGLVGYPNVGKSSTINSLMSAKKTSVSSTPGKTKHFQTLFLESNLMLCDCPGLVMPSFGGAQGEMVLGGILPIDTLTTWDQAVAFLSERIPKEVLEYRYGISLPSPFNYEDLLGAYASIRGFMTVRGLPDSSRAARIILKDYVNGRLNYCHCPPDQEQLEYQPQGKGHFRQFLGMGQDEELTKLGTKTKEAGSGEPRIKPPTLKQVSTETRLDGQFFTPPGAKAHMKGPQLIASGLSKPGIPIGAGDKPWKKHNNTKKREKLRRVYRHLDVD